MKITAISIIHPFNEKGKAVEQGKAEGDFSVLNPMYETLKKSNDRRKQSWMIRNFST